MILNEKINEISIIKINNGDQQVSTDKVIVEEPMEIILEWSTSNGRMQKNIAVILRTPGQEEELISGFLFTEGVISNTHVIKSIKQNKGNPNSLICILHENIIPQLKNAQRNFYSTSSCGICGKASIEAIDVESQFKNREADLSLNISDLFLMPSVLKNAQELFNQTGGIHACALFYPDGQLFQVREDIGRHNALDKLIGYAVLNDLLPLSNFILLLSGRAGFELIQKAAMAGIKIIIAIGAPSNLAIELAKENAITLVGFMRDLSCNIYSDFNRIRKL